MDVLYEIRTAKPFLRWAGGKRWLLPVFDDLSKNIDINRYFEPFLGGGSVYFHLDAPSAFISDTNLELINTYIELRDNLDSVLKILKTFDNTKDCYYNARGCNSEDRAYNAAKFIFLNQTSYNGLYRVNKLGQYNVPYGFRCNYWIDEENLRRVNQKLQNTSISHASFETIENQISTGDLVFLDPPYTVSHNKNGFIKYNQTLFTFEDQIRLNSLVDKIIRVKAFYVLTNGANKVIQELFSKDGSQEVILERFSLLGGKHAKRTKIEELLFSNLPIAKE